MERLSSRPSDLKMTTSSLFYRNQSRRSGELSVRCEAAMLTCSKLMGSDGAQSVFLLMIVKLTILRILVSQIKAIKGFRRSINISWNLVWFSWTCWLSWYVIARVSPSVPSRYFRTRYEMNSQSSLSIDCRVLQSLNFTIGNCPFIFI